MPHEFLSFDQTRNRSLACSFLKTLLDENTRRGGKKRKKEKTREINDRFHYYIGLAVISDRGALAKRAVVIDAFDNGGGGGHFIEFQGKNGDYSRAIKAAGSRFAGIAA